MKDRFDDDDDAELDAHLMDELMDQMSGHDADRLYPPESKAPAVIEIHIRPGGAPAEAMKDEDAKRGEGMLPKPDEMNGMMKRAMR